MRSVRPDRWTAVLLSLAVPGAGQLFVRHGSCLVWFLAAACLSASAPLLAPLGAEAAAAANFGGMALLGVASAVHVRHCLAPSGKKRHVASHVCCDGGAGSTVRLRIELDVARPTVEVWRVVADLERFVCVDPFHSRVVVLGPTLRPGVELALEHQALGATFWRFGRLLVWREGHGYAFSDLSARGRRHGFPHVFFVSVRPVADARTCLRIDIRGRWTARWLPSWARRGWLLAVCREHARLLRAHFSEDDA